MRAQVLCKDILEARHGSQLLRQAVCSRPSLAHPQVEIRELTRDSPLQSRSCRLNLDGGTDSLYVIPTILPLLCAS